MIRYRGQPRFFSLGGKALVCTSGEYSDHQFLERELKALVAEDAAHAEETGTCSSSSSSSSNGPQLSLTPKALASFTSRVLYQKRSRFNPYWLSVVVAGHMGAPKGIHEQQQQQQQQQQEMYLGTMDMLGTFFEEQVVATGRFPVSLLLLLLVYVQLTPRSGYL